MFAHVSVFLCVIVSLSFGQLLTPDRQCLPDTNDFATKVEKSSVVVYGKAMAKILNVGSESIFHIFYQVDCILKGPATLRQINITNAGKKMEKFLKSNLKNIFQVEYPVNNTVKSSQSVAVILSLFSNQFQQINQILKHFLQLISLKFVKKEILPINYWLEHAIYIELYPANR